MTPNMTIARANIKPPTSQFRGEVAVAVVAARVAATHRTEAAAAAARAGDLCEKRRAADDQRPCCPSTLSREVNIKSWELCFAKLTWNCRIESNRLLDSIRRIEYNCRIEI